MALVNVTINGKVIRCEEGTSIIKLSIDNGFFIPHYCWHPGLVPEGNCRMCLVKTSTSRKLEASCMMKAQDKMEIQTEAAEVKEARKSVLEFLLANHPLDCPVCDKSGECLLQDYTFNWRSGLSRFPGIDEKNIKPTKDLSDKIKIWGSRCIVCTRCIRFCRDVVGDEQLTVVQRGDRSYIDVFPGMPIDNKMSLNVVDICPVGALINKDFLYKARVWFTESKPTVCNLCSKGCNINATVLKNEVKRIMPRYNKDINGYWMCDDGRTAHYSVGSVRRLVRPLGGISSIVTSIELLASKFGPSSVGFVISSGNTCEEIDAFRRLVQRFDGAAVGFITNEGTETRYKQFTIEPEKSPNRRYLEDVFGVEAVKRGLGDIVSRAAEESLKALVVFNAIPFKTIESSDAVKLECVEFMAVISHTETGLEKKANCIIPAQSYLEKTGTFVNSAGIRQNFNPVVEPPPYAVNELEFLNSMIEALESSRNQAAVKS